MPTSDATKHILVLSPHLHLSPKCSLPCFRLWN